MSKSKQIQWFNGPVANPLTASQVRTRRKMPGEIRCFDHWYNALTSALNNYRPPWINYYGQMHRPINPFHPDLQITDREELWRTQYESFTNERQAILSALKKFKVEVVDQIYPGLRDPWEMVGKSQRGKTLFRGMEPRQDIKAVKTAQFYVIQVTLEAYIVRAVEEKAFNELRRGFLFDYLIHEMIGECVFFGGRDYEK